MNAIDLIKSDHQTVERLFGSYESASGPEQKRTIVRDVVRELSMHAALEEQMLYPTARMRVQNGNALAETAISEHQTMKQLLAQLEGMDPSADNYDETVTTLMTHVRQHVEEEEGTLLPELQSRLSDQELVQFGFLMGQAKNLMPTHPHPEVPGYATAQLLAGPWASIADRMRDFFEALTPRPR